jgi:hypothetical protein
MNPTKTIARYLTLACTAGHALAVITFEDLSFTAGDYENGAHLPGGELITNDPWGDGSVPSQGVKNSSFTSGAGTVGTFANSHTNVYGDANGGGGVIYDFWSGWAYSRTTDGTTSGYGNQYSAVAGGGAGGSANYAVAYNAVTIDFSADVDFSGGGLFVTNTTYTHHSMRDGDLFAKKFGGSGGTDPDWFLLTIEGFNGGLTTGTVNFYLADYRFANDAQDYLVDDWTFVDLSSLGAVDQLAFALSSSDNGSYGMNTPGYFALDNIDIGLLPEPAASSLALAGLLGTTILRRRRRPLPRA